MNRILKIIEMLRDETQMIEKARMKENTFRRKRKIKLLDLVLIILTSLKKTLSIELEEYYQRAAQEKIEYSNTAFLKQRYNLNPELFKKLNKAYLKDYSDDDVFLAIDGSKIELPNTEDNKKEFGTQGNKYVDGPARALLSGIYDVKNHYYLDVQMFKYTDSEIRLAKLNIEEASEIIGTKKMIVMMDRGYMSLEFMRYLMEKEIRFIIRCPKGMFVKEWKEMQSDDEEVKIKHTASRMAKIKIRHEESYEKIKKEKETIVRFVKIPLNTGETEYIITNIPKEKITKEKMKEIYGSRWEIEKGYDNLKNKLELENFTGKKSIIIYQDVYSRVLSYNMLMDIINEANEKLKENNKEKDNKLRYQVNINKAVGFYSCAIVKIILEGKIKKQERLLKQLVKKMAKEVSAIRKGRPSSSRNFKATNKYRCNLKSNI